ncbi:hypothetical protein STEG23_004024 [Scotinomys teguina]
MEAVESSLYVDEDLGLDFLHAGGQNEPNHQSRTLQKQSTTALVVDGTLQTDQESPIGCGNEQQVSSVQMTSVTLYPTSGIKKQKRLCDTAMIL